MPDPGEAFKARIIEADARFRVPPALDATTEFFWTSGADGHLRFQRCGECGHFLHPPGPRCPACGSAQLAPEVVSGYATLVSFTVNHQPWDGDPNPFVVALVEVAEQPGLRLTTNLVGCEPQDPTIGMPLRVVFEHRHYDARGDIWFPLFEPPAGPLDGSAP